MCEWTSDETDCDGRHHSGNDSECLIANLRAVDAFEQFEMAENRGIMAPLWDRVGSHQRDYTAEAAGY